VASVVDICNLALSHIGDEANVSSIDPPEGSMQADLCARFYPVARDVLLEMHNWTFAVVRVALAEVDNDLADVWAYAYAMPSDIVRAMAVYPYECTDDDKGADYIIESGVIYTNESAATIRYVAKVTDTTKFTPMFVSALSWLLASYLVGPVTKDPNRRDVVYKHFLMELARAAAANANSVKPVRMHTPDFIGAR